MTHQHDDDNDDLMDSNSSLRFIYMDDERLLSPSFLHDGMRVSGEGYWSQHCSHHFPLPALSPPLSPTSGEAHQLGRFNSNRNNNNDSLSFCSHDEKTGMQKSTRKSLSHVLTSPVRAAKGKISFSPRKSTKPTLFHNKGHKRNSKEWRKDLDLPRDVVTQDEAIAFLVAKELSMLDF
jgi:hypothetical protein